MLRALTVVLLTLLCTSVIADSREDAQRQLEATKRDIAEMQKLLKSIQSEKSGLQKQLQSTETEMGELEKQVKDLQEQLDEGEKKLEQLDGQKKKLEQSRLDQQKLIAIQVRAAYQSGRQEYLKLLLNQEQPEKVSRTLTYYNYVNQARIDQLSEFNDTLRQLSSVEQDILSEQAQLTERQGVLKEQQDKLAQVREARQEALAKLNKDYSIRSRALEAREQERAELNKVLKTIEETLARQAREAEAARQRALAEARQAEARRQAANKAPRPANTPEIAVSSSAPAFGGPFAKAQGKLPWPVNGRLLARFGSPRGDDPRAKWDGVLIAAGAGTQVHAIHAGRVVFADWLRGAGQLVIIDHGNGYLSLYGHNQSLLKSAGDQVKAGDTIATVGTSGGQDTPALYFAIRQKGRPSDPVAWCRAQG
ncbi:septal ring factor EnvC (AmiA/AmiB activator) [Pseudomonas duriflava]|uniref:Septal ring factor EnvC (AmiA/AmiB activator) n=1 Tax=Pseudomonas duriflava TaxID=459528 RepID=A0A562QKP1_9PSED|nr:murein hydrolase activator EnvC [Pseudomonas duriflava]TWI56616.1 septal ring factor EnvC (AmiA/AmiB activator) [Pseudomonas duriflava]